MRKKFFNRIVSFLTVLAMIIPMAVQFTVSAEETEKYPYAMFGRNGIVMTATSNMCVNGAIHTNKMAEITAVNKNINGKLTTGNDIEKRVKHVYADTKIYENYFTENCDLYEEEYVYSELNIHINNPLFCYNNITLNGNVSLNSNLGTLMNLNVTGEVKNANSSVVYSKYGDITIENDSTANINGLIYAPLGTLTINSPNVTINGIIIADKVVINSSNVNINYNDNVARFIGTISEVYDFSGLEYLPEEWLGDTDEDDLFDIYEKVIDTDPLDYDTDDDALPDGYEVITLGTDPLEIDTDGNGVSDADEDFDTDNLTNFGEYRNGTEPFNPDTDDDGYLDGDEVHKYGTLPLNPDTDVDGLLDGDEGYDGTIYAKSGVYFDPLNPDTDGDGILDGDEAFAQRKQQAVETHDKVITEITVDMTTNGNLERNLTIESMYNIDAMTTNVNALVGEPFNFETPTSFEKATITFKIDKAMLGEGVEFDNLIILWYNEEKQIFEEVDTTRSWEYSTISTTTTHFSQYMIVDSQKWYSDWNTSLAELRKMWVSDTSYTRNLHTIVLMDCSSSMEDSDKYVWSLESGYNGVTDDNIETIGNSISQQGEQEYYCVKSCDRFRICDGIIDNKSSGDSVAIITFSNNVLSNSGLIYTQSTLREVLDNSIDNLSGTANLRKALDSALNLVVPDTTDLYRIIAITDSKVSLGTISSDEFANNVILNIVNVGTSEIGGNIETVAQATGGDVYIAESANSLTTQFGETVISPPKFAGVDSDGDTIPDIVELYGLQPNGKPIGTYINQTDSDGDGLDDNVELGYVPLEIYFESQSDYYKYFSYKSDPSVADTDGDGLIDGKRVYEDNGKVLCPIDPNPLKYDGPTGVWKAQYDIATSQQEKIATQYSDNRPVSNVVMKEIAKQADTLVEILLEHEELANEWALNKFKELFKESAENKAAEVAGAEFLEFAMDSNGTAYHSQLDIWQKAFGYNDIYDKVFENASDMNVNKMSFDYNGKEYILWSWKGDYWNLQSGAETGLYVENQEMNNKGYETKHYDVVDFTLPMTLSLYNCYGESVENVFTWAPDDRQWWITGFNPRYTEANPYNMITVGSVDFTGYEEMYNSFKSKYDTGDNNMIFDNEFHTVWIVW